MLSLEGKKSLGASVEVLSREIEVLMGTMGMVTVVVNQLAWETIVATMWGAGMIHGVASERAMRIGHGAVGLSIAGQTMAMAVGIVMGIGLMQIGGAATLLRTMAKFTVLLYLGVNLAVEGEYQQRDKENAGQLPR